MFGRSSGKAAVSALVSALGSALVSALILAGGPVLAEPNGSGVIRFPSPSASPSPGASASPSASPSASVVTGAAPLAMAASSAPALPAAKPLAGTTLGDLADMQREKLLKKAREIPGTEPGKTSGSPIPVVPAIPLGGPTGEKIAKPDKLALKDQPKTPILRAVMGFVGQEQAEFGMESGNVVMRKGDVIAGWTVVGFGQGGVQLERRVRARNSPATVAKRLLNVGQRL